MASAAIAAPVSVDIPGAADAGRISEREQKKQEIPRALESSPPMQVIPFSVEAPKGSEKITINLKEVHVDGMTVFSEKDMIDIYTPYLGKKITLNTLWMMAGRMTERYQTAGYFLSRVIVPQQEVTTGIIRFHAVEGHIEEIDAPKELLEHDVVRAWFDRLKAYRPIKAAQLESVILQLNDLPGVQLRAVLQPASDVHMAQDGGVKIKLENTDTGGVHGAVQFDNFGSRYIGPYEVTTNLDFEAIPLQRTHVTALTALPFDEMHYGSITQEIPVFPGGTFSISGSHTNSAPVDSLKISEVRSNSTEVDAGLNYQWIRQRDENLSLRLDFDVRSVNTNILDTPQTRDDLRVLRFGGNYEWRDAWDASDYIGATVSQGLDLFGSSKAGDQYLSRSEAEPGFTKVVLNLRREQPIYENWSLVTAGMAQAASGPLFASEEIGYGGRLYGRAFDDSEITGDHGVMASAELRYSGLPEWQGMRSQLYSFYDFGAVWNDDSTQTARAVGSAVGGGVRLQSELGVASDLGVAFPLAREISTPLNGQKDGPRVVLQIGYGF